MPKATVAAIGVAALLWGAAIGAQAPAGEPPSVLEVMVEQVMPSSDALFNAAVEPPADDAAWEALADQARALAAAGEGLLEDGRARDAGGWTAVTRAMIDVANQSLEAAGARDLDRLAALGDALYETCVNCHGQYLQN